MRKIFRFLSGTAALLVFCSAAVVTVNKTALISWAAPVRPGFAAFDKTLTYPMDDSYSVGLDPNVLFLLDTGSPMVMSSKGRMPLASVILNPHTRADMLKFCTYGTGTRPMVTTDNSGNVTAEPSDDPYMTDARAERYGRDIDDSNNIIGDQFCYYSPFPDKPYYLTFRDKTAANWNGKGRVPAVLSGIADYLPGRSKAGRRVPLDLANQYLVPNDSRMYQMKLVLWRLLSEENQALLSRMRTAMALSYQEENYPFAGYSADFYKNSPFGVRTSYGYYSQVSSGDFRSPALGGPPLVDNIRFPYGTGPDWATGIGPDWKKDNYFDNSWKLKTFGYNDATSLMAGVDRAAYTFPVDSPEWLAVNRAILKLPFDYLYKATRSGFQPTANLVTFRKYINGIEGGNGKSFLEPEMIADGQTPLAMAIYGRDHHMKGGVIKKAGDGTGFDKRHYPSIYFETEKGTQKQYYHEGNSYVTYRDFLLHDDMSGGDIRAGLGVGSVIDFFSPPAKALTFASNTIGYFPATGSCQSNWLVVFTAGNDSDPRTLTAAEAVKKLYANTKTIRGRNWNKVKNKWEEKNFAMDYGVRTLVVGFVDPNAKDATSVKLRKSLEEMAAYGVPHADGSPNYDSKPYFANDAPSLIASLKAVLMRINADRFASSAPVITGEDGKNASSFLYSPSFKVSAFDQWAGYFNKYMLSKDQQLPVWEFNDRLKKNPSGRTLYTPAAFDGDYTTTALLNVNTMPNAIFANMTAVPAAYADDFKNWLRDYRKRVGSGWVPSESILGDMEHAGFALVPDGGDSRVYLQTNRGVLHSVKDKDGSEAWAFIPPNIFQGRLKALKFDRTTNVWLNGDGLTSLNSLPMDLLDGSLIAEKVRDAYGNYKTVLMGNLGWGGNGLYALDVTPPAALPNFLWAVDNARYGKGREASPLINGVVRWGAAASLNVPGTYDYSDLGLTIVVPSTISVDDKGYGQPGDVTVLPGGLGYRLGDDDHGKAVFVIEPLTGEILRIIKNDIAGFEDPTAGRTRSLGMVISPAVYCYYDKRNYASDKYGEAEKTVKNFLTTDSNGNVLFCDVRDTPPSMWKLKSIFQLKSSAKTGGKPISIPKALLWVTNQRNRDEWVFGGTSDIMAPDQNLSRKMENPEQYIWGQNVSKASGDVTTADLFQMDYMADDPKGYKIPGSYGVGRSAVHEYDPSAHPAGWALKLRPAGAETKGEYVTTSPFFFHNTLFVSTFLPKPVPVNMASRDLCPELGDSKLYRFDPFTGKGLASGGGYQATVYKDIKITGISAHRDPVTGEVTVYLTVKPLKPGATGTDKPMITIKMPPLIGTKFTVSADIPYIEYWKETY